MVVHYGPDRTSVEVSMRNFFSLISVGAVLYQNNLVSLAFSGKTALKHTY